MKKTPKQKHKEGTLVAFLLDRTGSMSSVKQETIGGFNGYLDELVKKPESKDIRFHFTQFDTVGIDVVHDCVPLNRTVKLTDETYLPRAGTPLYDAIGKTIRQIQDKVNGDKVLFVVLTDGQENSSSEWTKETVRGLIKEKEDKDKWTFAYIGVGPDAWAANAGLAMGTMGASNVLRSTSSNIKGTYGHLASATVKRARMAGGQCVNSVFGGKQLDQDVKK